MKEQTDIVPPAHSGPSSGGTSANPQEILFQKFSSLFLQEIDTIVKGYPAPGYKNTPTGPKKNRIYRTEHRVPNLKDSNQHLSGQVCLIARPIRRDNNCLWGAIDVDDYRISYTELRWRSKKHNLPLSWFQSKSKGSHGFAFFNEPRPARLVRLLLKKWAAMLDISGSEVFPKSDTLENPDACGHSIALPGFGNAVDFVKFQPIIYSVPPHQWDLPQEAKIAPVEYSDEGGYWDVCAVEAMLKAFKEQIPRFRFHRSRKGYAVLCPGQTEIGWPDGNRHSTNKDHADWESEIWIENGWLAYRCFHQHCSEPKKTFTDWLDFWDPLRRRFDFDQWQAAETALAEQRFLADYGRVSCRS